MSEPPATLLRLTRFLGSDPSRTMSRGWCWYSLVGGVVISALFVEIWITSSDSDRSRAFFDPLMICMSLMFAVRGASDLLKESREGISLWFSALYGLLFIPMVLLAGAFLYAWVGYPAVLAWAAFVVLDRVWARARRRRT